MGQVVDPAVSETKFAREIGEFRSLEPAYRRRGWLLLRASFPEVLVVMAAPQLAPPAIVTGVLLDYTDYDARPPSVRFVDPFTEEPYPAERLPNGLLRAVPQEIPAGMLPPGVEPPLAHVALMQSYGPGTIPFLCLPGVREYHDHPGHSGDHWELHRAVGAGRLVRILEVIDKYGVAPLEGYNLQLIPRVTGFRQSEPPR